MHTTTQSKSLASILYSKAAVARICGCSHQIIARVEIWWKVIFVVFKKGHGLRPKFVSKKSFHQNFQTFMKRNTGKLEIYPHNQPYKFAVVNPQGDTYEVSIEEEEITCTCQDFDFQSKNRDVLTLETGTRWIPKCKHIHKVLELGDREELRDLINSEGGVEFDADDNWLISDDWVSDYEYSQVPPNW
ncbi:hypothetical protein H4N54_01965 [Limnospira fusiformis KN01]|uniref:hypothetical protein n=1 Tax=Limnospira TaxID=2596745 RepID=UPI001658C2A2|nr:MULTISPECIES: hypothetical protein [Limnospira]MDT9198307.1 hypothetical protein [Limnospira sp. PMC 1042.18]ULB46189.1 hypothetical protein H4N54_01965 [Limnospira fusiformis KN01]